MVLGLKKDVVDRQLCRGGLADLAEAVDVLVWHGPRSSRNSALLRKVAAPVTSRPLWSSPLARQHVNALSLGTCSTDRKVFSTPLRTPTTTSRDTANLTVEPISSAEAGRDSLMYDVVVGSSIGLS